MSNDAKNSLGVPESDKKDNKRKMTQAIIEEGGKEQYEFLEDDDDFEEFENDEVDYDAILGTDVEMNDGQAKTGEEVDRKLWHTDWDDEEQSGDFIAHLRAEVQKK